MSDVYLDYNGSSPLDNRVTAAMIPVLRDGVGNASSPHCFGMRQAGLVEAARAQVAGLVGGRTSGVIFTAGATEANNHALRGLLETADPGCRRILVSAVEHASIRETAAWISQQSLAKVQTIPVEPGGYVDLDALDNLLSNDVLLVSVMAANSETGVLNPISEVADLAHAVGALVHCDATQQVGRLPFHADDLGVDLLSISGHKICGPAGVGALVGSRAALKRMRPLIHGGGHERGLRSGSLNVAGIVGLGSAAELAATEGDADSSRISPLRDRLVHGVMDRLDGVIEIGDVTRRLPNTADVRFVRADAEAVMVNMGHVAVSAGSACSAGTIEPSPVLLAMGIDRDAASEVIRFSLGRFTNAEEIDSAVESVVTAVDYVRTMTGEGARQ